MSFDKWIHPCDPRHKTQHMFIPPQSPQAPLQVNPFSIPTPEQPPICSLSLGEFAFSRLACKWNHVMHAFATCLVSFLKHNIFETRDAACVCGLCPSIAE